MGNFMIQCLKTFCYIDFSKISFLQKGTTFITEKMKGLLEDHYGAMPYYELLHGLILEIEARDKSKNEILEEFESIKKDYNSQIDYLNKEVGRLNLKEEVDQLKTVIDEKKLDLMRSKKRVT